MSTKLGVVQYGVPRTTGGRPFNEHKPSILSEFDSGSFLTRKLSDSEQLASNSPDLVSRMVSQANLGTYYNSNGPTPDPNGVQSYYSAGYYVVLDINNSQPICYVDASQPTVAIDLQQNNPALQTVMNAVPLPTDLTINELHEDGPDHSLVIYQAQQGYWDFWETAYLSGSYQCDYGGGKTLPANGIWPNNWGMTASGIATAAGSFTIADWVAGVARHALIMALAITADYHVAPITRHDSGTSVAAGSSYAANNYALPEGTKFRLPAGYNVASYVASQDNSAVPLVYRADWKRLLTIFLTAIRDYGLVIMDTTGGVIGFNVEPVKLIGTPYHWARPEEVPVWWGAQHMFYDSGSIGLFIPWSDMQVIEPQAAT